VEDGVAGEFEKKLDAELGASSDGSKDEDEGAKAASVSADTVESGGVPGSKGSVLRGPVRGG